MRQCWWITFIALFAVLGCNHGADIDIVLPHGYKGIVEVHEVPSAPEMEVIDNKITLHVPANGIVEVKSLDPYHRVHSSRVVDADGNELNDAGYIGEIPDTVQWYDLGVSYSNGPNGIGDKPKRVGYFIGTPEEAKAIDRAAVGF